MNKKRSTVYSSNDLNISDNVIVKVKTMNVNNPTVIEVVLSFIAIPNDKRFPSEYIRSINEIKKTYFKACYEYNHSRGEIYRSDYIIDFNFTSANLKKDYNKSVSMSLYLRQKSHLQINELESDIVETFRSLVDKMIDKCNCENFKCSKVKLKKNSQENESRN
jgi:hypothetical protein